MASTRRIGIGLAAVSVLGYAIGVAAPYPGRAASIVGLMIGVTLYAIGREDGESI
jgi:hypothetical protein